ncbi:ChaN family lipoprotein [Phreatobacter stygius]|uniref:Haem-binding uptake Tiki superfamily ChaN domain-containing protein n=1 Tax=Phreatobacter stygius TaxID=1940610 RepID=A0A4D7AVW0_9HYPH|nr:ChaN family lipoprotein [Phreatobacter stygius]QCI65159.1 hypothetical protein E8M01_13630 [Phreatobacter stygius]
MTFLEHPRATWLDPTSGGLRDQAELMHAVARQQVVLLGETHDVAEIHRWQLHVTTYLHGLRPHLAVGYEMFPRRVQPVLDRWVEGAYSTAGFLEAVEWPDVWGFDAELYLPLLHFCRQQRVRMLALNCHRPLVTRVGKEGWKAIPEDERDGLTPAAAATPAYRDYLFAITGGAGPARTAASAQDPAFDRFVRAQQTWDRAFACNIARVLDEAEPPLVVGIIGRGHLEYGHGTPFQLRDLGVGPVAVLLPTDQARHQAGAISGLADAIFRLDTPEPPSAFRARRDRQT